MLLVAGKVAGKKAAPSTSMASRSGDGDPGRKQVERQSGRPTPAFTETEPNTRLLLVRHGQTPSDLKHLLDTADPGPGLTPLGLEQAAALPDVPAGERIDALYASTLLRTQLTAAPLATRTGPEVVVRDGIRELSAGDLEMRGDTEAVETCLTTASAWSAGDTGRRMPGGENGVEALGRYDAVVEEAAATGAETVAVISHGAAIRMWAAARAENVDADFASAHALRNTGVAILSGAPGEGWRAHRWEDHSAGPEAGGPDTSGPAGEAVEDAREGAHGRLAPQQVRGAHAQVSPLPVVR